MAHIEYKAKDLNQEYYQEYYSYFDHLFCRARDANGLQCVYALLRVSGVEDGGWDPFIEAQEALIEFSKILKNISKKGICKSSFRLALLIYCHSVEMSAPYHILFNLLQCIQKKDYIPFPFPGQLNKKKSFSIRPLLPVAKLAKIEEECEKIDETKLINKFKTFFDDEIRNAFYHSDYSFTDEEFRICENSLSRTVLLEDLSEKLARCFAFYQAFFDIYKHIRFSFKKSKKFHRLQNFEVFELITNSKEGLVGFKMHFSNGAQAFFQRQKERVHGINIRLEEDGINFFVADQSKLQYKWLVNGNTFREKNTRYNAPCTWKPILFHGNSGDIINEIKKETSDKDIQGCLFYIKCTGHESIEFVIKSDKQINKNELKNSKIKTILCECSSKNNWIYDCTYYANSNKAREIKKGINRIKKHIAGLCQKGIKCDYILKYSLFAKADPKKNDNGSFTVSYSTTDPRSTLCVSTFSVLPQTDWKIKAEWAE